MSGGKTIFCVGANHNTAHLDLREKLFLSFDAIEAALPDICADTAVDEVMILSTCNRLEVIGAGSDDLNDEKIIRLYQAMQEKAHGRGVISEAKLRESIYHFTGKEAVNHIFQVASGLDSLVVGETQITGQFKDAARVSRERKTMGSLLDRISQDALHACKKVRTLTDIGRKPVSISHVAIDLANRLYGHISGHKLLVIGAGEMAVVASRTALKYDPKEMFIMNRTLSKAEKLVTELGRGQAFGLEDLSTILPQADVIISATGAEEAIIDVDAIKRARRARKNQPLFLIDIALPRDIEPECGNLEDIYLFDIDDLKQVVGEHMEERRAAAEKGRRIIEEQADATMRWLNNIRLKPALSGFRNYLDDLIKRETEKTLTKGALRDLNEVQVKGLMRLMQSVAGKIAGDAGTHVNTPPEGFYQEQMAAALAALFPIPDKKEQES